MNPNLGLYSGLWDAFRSLNERKRENQVGLSTNEWARWRLMRCQIEEALFQHPRDPAKDTRMFLRVPTSFRVTYWIGRTKKDCWATILGEGGLFLATEELYPLGQRLSLLLFPNAHGAPLEIKGDVVWSNTQGPTPDRGMGIRFHSPSEQQRQKIYNWVDEAARSVLLERRLSTRMDIGIDIEIVAGGTAFIFKTRDIGLGGMFAYSFITAWPGQQFQFKVSVPGEIVPVVGNAEVVWAEIGSSGKSSGFGLRFLDFIKGTQSAIPKVLSQHAFREFHPTHERPRRHARIKRRLKLRFHAENSFGTTHIQDIGSGGVFLQSREPPPLGSKIELMVGDPIISDSLTLIGKVVRVVPADPLKPNQIPGVGVAFEEMSRMRSEFLTELLKRFLVEGND